MCWAGWTPWASLLEQQWLCEFARRVSLWMSWRLHQRWPIYLPRWVNPHLFQESIQDNLLEWQKFMIDGVLFWQASACYFRQDFSMLHFILTSILKASIHDMFFIATIGRSWRVCFGSEHLWPQGTLHQHRRQLCLRMHGRLCWHARRLHS